MSLAYNLDDNEVASSEEQVKLTNLGRFPGKVLLHYERIFSLGELETGTCCKVKSTAVDAILSGSNVIYFEGKEFVDNLHKISGSRIFTEWLKRLCKVDLLVINGLVPEKIPLFLMGIFLRIVIERQNEKVTLVVLDPVKNRE